MAREVANLLPAPAALPRTRQTRRDYSSLAEGPINTELLKNGTPLLSKSYSQRVSCAFINPNCARKEMSDVVSCQYKYALWVILAPANGPVLV